MPFEFLEHTADIKLRVWESSLEALYRSAAEGMMEYLYGENARAMKPGRYQTLILQAPDRESLMVEWLTRLLFLSSTAYSVCADITILTLTATRLEARVGLTGASAREEIKAVTYSELRIERTSDHWETAITFDI